MNNKIKTIQTSVIRSKTWLSEDIDNLNIILQETINNFVDKDDTIINIEMKTDYSGLSRFWIYIKKE